MSAEIFKLSSAAFCLATPVGGLLVYLFFGLGLLALLSFFVIYLFCQLAKAEVEMKNEIAKQLNRDLALAEAKLNANKMATKDEKSHHQVEQRNFIPLLSRFIIFCGFS